LNKHSFGNVNKKLNQVQERISEPEGRYFKISQAYKERERERERER
jgi:hypothetical protein